jgi:dihydroorotate dehydrogenase
MEGLPPISIADIDIAVKIVRECASSCKVPVGYKQSPESGWPRMAYMAKKCKDAGAKFVSCTNAVIGLPQIDIYNGGRMYYHYGRKP